MTDLSNIFHYLEIEIDYILKDKITFCKNIYLKKVFDYFDMTNYKPTSLPINPRVANFLQFFDGIVDPKTIKL